MIGQIHLAIGQSNLFINERFKQFSGLIDDCELKRGEKETKVEDLAGFWDMIFYQVEDLKSKYDQLEMLQSNKWIAPEVVEQQQSSFNKCNNTTAAIKSLKPVIDNQSNIIKNNNNNKRTTMATMNNNNGILLKSTNNNGYYNNNINGKDNENGNTLVDGIVPMKKSAVRSNFREFLKNKRKDGFSNYNQNYITSESTTNTNNNGIITLITANTNNTTTTASTTNKC